MPGDIGHLLIFRIRRYGQYCLYTIVSGNTQIMDRTEIKLNKKGHLIVISIFASVIIFSIWGLTMPDVEIGYKFIMAAFILLLFYQSYRILIVIDDPVIILTKTTIHIRYKNKDNIYLWSDITDYKVHYKRNDEGVEYTLTLLTNLNSETFQITGISKMPDELMKIIDDFRK